MTAPATTISRTNRPTATAALTLPSMPDTSPALQATLRQVLERLAVLDGQRGDDLDAAVTKRELVDAGIATVKRGAGGVSLEQGYDGGEWANIPYLMAMPTPKAPTFKTSISVNFLFWELPNARGVGATQIFRRTNSTDGTIIASPVGAMYADLPVEFGVTYYYKIRFVSERGTPGDWSSEVRVVSEVDPAFVIETLQGQINESELATALRDKVKTGGRFDTAIENEATTRKTATDALASQINTVSARVGDVSTAVQAETTARINADGSVIAKYTSTATAGGKTAGFTYGSDGKISEFYIMADTFAVLHQDGATQRTTEPFIVDSGKVYINTAVIKDASISTAKIADLTATVATIAKANIYDAAIGGSIYSSNYNATTKTGFSLNQDGSAFFGGNTTFAGKMEVRRAGSGAGVDITNDGIRVYDASGVLRVAIGKLA